MKKVATKPAPPQRVSRKQKCTAETFSKLSADLKKLAGKAQGKLSSLEDRGLDAVLVDQFDGLKRGMTLIETFLANADHSIARTRPDKEAG